MKRIEIKPTGIIHSPYKEIEDIPCQGYKSDLAKPFLDSGLKGIFSIRGPSRPNYIGLSIVRLLERKDNILKVGDIDVLDGTPLIDIKPYVSKFDIKENVKNGWLEGKT